MNSLHYVYILYTQDGNLIKIGQSENPRGRLSSLSSDYSFNRKRGVVLSTPSRAVALKVENIILRTLSDYSRPQHGQSGYEFLDGQVDHLVLGLLQAFDSVPGYNLDFNYFTPVVGVCPSVQVVDATLRLLGQRVRSARLGKGLTRRDLSELSGVAQSTVKRLEGGGNCSFRALFKIFDVLESDALHNLLSKVKTTDRQRGLRKSK